MSTLAPTADEIRELAFEVGFDGVGICNSQSAPRFEYLTDWVEQGKHGGMQYIADRLEAYRHPKSILDGVESIVMLTTSYETAKPQPTSKGQGRVARYAWGSVDYHDLIHQRFNRIKRKLNEQFKQVEIMGVVDTAPMLER